MIQQDALAAIGLLSGEMGKAQGIWNQNWEDNIPHRWEELRQQRDYKSGEINAMLARGIGEEAFNKLLGKVIPHHGYIMPLINAYTDSDYQVTDAIRDTAISIGKGQLGRWILPGAIDAADIVWSGYEAASSVSTTPTLMYDQVFDAYDTFENTFADGQPVLNKLAIDPAKTHVVMEDVYSQTWVDSTDPRIGSFQPMGNQNYADILRARESLGLMPDATIRTLREDYPELPYGASESFSEWLRRNKKTIVDPGIQTWEEVLINHARSGEIPSLAAIRSDAQNYAYLTSSFNQHFSEDELGEKVEHATDKMRYFQNAAGDAEYELGMLQSGFSYAREGAGEFTAATDDLALSTGTAEQALAAAGLSGNATTQVLDLMRSAGLDPATAAWDELAVAVQVWGDATDTEVTRVIGRLGELSSAQGGGGTAPGGSTGGGGTDDRTQRALDQLMALAYRVAERRADMGGKPQEYVVHELGKVLGQLRGPGSLEEQLALLRAFFAGSAHGISFGLGPSADQLGFNIPQFAGGGTVPGPLGAPQLIVAHGGEHIVPHRATGSPTIIRIELDREVLAQAVLGDLLRLQGREVTLGLS